MKRVTFLIGNGFDINVGLKTRYSQFYKDYISRYPHDYIAQAIKSDYGYWADMEEALGGYTAEVSKEEDKRFWESENLLEISLADYLEQEMKRINISEEMKNKIVSKMERALTHFDEEFPIAQRSTISKTINNLADSIVYSFISFNYTDAFDRCIALLKEKHPRMLVTHKAPNQINYEHSIGDILHIHGTVNDQIVLGVNDIEQITNERYKENKVYKNILVKAEANRQLGNNHTERAEGIIDSSILICVYGMSLGITDKRWWSYICNWLQKSKENRLIIFQKNENRHIRIGRFELFSKQEEVLQRLRLNSGIDDENWNKIEEKILIKFDSEIFDFSLV